MCHVDTEQAIVQSGLNEDVYLRLLRGCGVISGKVDKFSAVCTA